ncbi:MAG: AAA family ATPase [Anaerolineales bacterium]|nr:AAA family ATPase [Anaerolineales bacterium]
MNFFRSEEHVKNWSLYTPLGEDYILPISEWAEIFSSKIFKNRLASDYLSHSDEYVQDYHHSLKEIGKTSPFFQIPFIADLDTVLLHKYQVVGNYTRYEESVLNDLKDAKQRILAGFVTNDQKRNNHLIWAAPGSGKTYFVDQIAKSIGDRVAYHEINLAKQSETEFPTRLESLEQEERPCLVLIDEIDAKPQEPWPYELLLPYLDAAADRGKPWVFVMAGSSRFSLTGIKEKINIRPKGTDLLSRIPVENQFIIAPMTFGDRLLVVLSQFLYAGREYGREIRAVEKLGLYCVILNTNLVNARQIHEFAVRAVQRVPPGEDRLKYDNLFIAGDPENKRFWLEVSNVANDLINKYVNIEE